jgi:hypothetical protein
MKKFKHIPTGEIFNHKLGYLMKEDETEFKIPLRMTKNSKDWEEIIEKDYEILSFKHKYGNLYTKLGLKGDNYYLIPDKLYTIDQLFSQSETYINCVKRLSDGETFTIGDKIESKFFEIEFILEKFKLDEGLGMLIESPENGFFISLCNIEKKTEPIIITEDKVEIFDEEEIVYGYLPKGSFDLNYVKAGRALNMKSWLFFSTEQARQKYAIENQPVLSLKEIGEVYKTAFKKNSKSDTYDGFEKQGFELRQMIKKKLNLK